MYSQYLKPYLSLIDVLSHTSGSATEDLYPRSYKASTKNTLNAVHDNFNPYSPGITSIFLPDSETNSGLAFVHIFLQQDAVRYAFYISHPRIDKQFSAAIVRAIMMLSLETTDEYVMDEGDAVI